MLDVIKLYAKLVCAFQKVVNVEPGGHDWKAKQKKYNFLKLLTKTDVKMVSYPINIFLFKIDLFWINF